jgi:hypothetical protein
MVGMMRRTNAVHQAARRVVARRRDRGERPHEMSLRSYPELGFTDSHHSQTYHHGEAEKIAKVIQINTLHTKMLAYYLDKLRNTPDAVGSGATHS